MYRNCVASLIESGSPLVMVLDFALQGREWRIPLIRGRSEAVEVAYETDEILVAVSCCVDAVVFC